MSIWSNLISALNGKGWTNVKEDAEPDDIATAIEQAQSMDEMRIQITEQVTQAVTAAFQSQIDTLNTQMTAVGEKLAACELELGQVKVMNSELEMQLSASGDQIKMLQAENEKLKADNKELSGKMAQKMADWKADGDQAPAHPKGNSAEAFMQKQKELRERKGGVKKAE